jgi:phosphatidylinositol-3-phosphatase
MYRVISGLVAGILLLFQGTPAAPRDLPRPDHIVIVIEENKGYDDIIGSSSAPYLNNLVEQGALLTKFYAMHHPSQANYMEFFSGNDQGIFNDICPKARFTKPSLGGSLIRGKLTFAGFAEDAPANPFVCQAGLYVMRHCPWVEFKDVPTSLTRNMSTFPTTANGFENLPAVAFVTPNLVNDMHSLSASDPRVTGSAAIPLEVANGDKWLKAHIDAYAQWAREHNSLLIITWDEDSAPYHYPNVRSKTIRTQPPANHIATIFVGSMVAAGTKSETVYSFYDLLRTIEDMYGLPLLGGSKTARDITDIWK